ncbi:DUF3631 domain-containing protein [Thiomicrorhabdus sp.]|uniref:DUF3631 domain-containing protein n=1 Tax=Thiomicrorhabdus sp. TaxID=2039724 RepID=UPI0029C6F81A|nr:DUF3631 domain-containing protein [Thiomicrorhabdus sp.]
MTNSPSFIDAKGKFQNSVAPSRETEDETLHRLAALSEIEYERCREQEAEILCMRVATLDRLVKHEKAQNSKPEVIESLEPWGEPVKLNQILNQIEDTIKKHAIIPLGGSTAISLWIASTYVINSFRIFPKLIVHSPEKRCGKSTVLDLVEAFSSKALFASSISKAAIYRTIQAYQPTLIIDEADTFIANRNDEMVGIINSGHAKNRAFVIRSEGDNHTPTKYSTWSPMVLASIKPLQGTIMDRGICIELRRKMNHEQTQRIPPDLSKQMTQQRRKLIRWAKDNANSVYSQQIEPPHQGNDRAVDNWIPLFTLASLASENWQTKVVTSYQLLNNRQEDPTPQIILLEDIRGILTNHKSDKIPSKILIATLLELEERPWQEWNKGKPITTNNLSRMLKPFGIQSNTIRYYNQPCKGYKTKQFDDAFKRYLPQK